jgi:sigma-B regulation protein RsbU (phosphoserine phosphatase)
MDWSKLGSVFLAMIGTIAVIDLIAVILEGAHSFSKLTGPKSQLIKAINLGILGGLFGIYATATGYTLDDGAVISVRDVGPLLAGCMGGPIGGLIAGLIAGLYRLLIGLPDVTAGTSIPCSVSTLLIGVACGFLKTSFNKRKHRALWALLIAACSEIFHLTLVFFYKWGVADVATAWGVIQEVALPFLLSNSLAFGLLIYTEDMIAKYKATETHAKAVESELSIATQIQESMLPKIFPDFPGRPEFALAASMDPAKEVGGDFYDFFFVDEDHFVFLVADVSGKGVPAALFMVTAKTLIKDNVQSGLPLAEAMTKSNQQLVEGNAQHMFVTCWVGEIELSTGKLTYVNCGHNPPLLSNDGASFNYLKDFSGFVLGGSLKTHYKAFTTTLKESDRLFAYTDGVTEAMNPKNEQFGEKRLVSYLESLPAETASEEVIASLKGEVRKFADGAEQSDDITMVYLAVKGFYATKKVPASLESFDELSSFMGQELSKKGVSEAVKNKLDIILDELFSNIVKYSGANGVAFGVFIHEKRILLRFEYGGDLFDVTATATPDLNAPLKERKIGGLGLYMVKKLSDGFTYKVVNHHNVVTIEKKF